MLFRRPPTAVRLAGLAATLGVVVLVAGCSASLPHPVVDLHTSPVAARRSPTPTPTTSSAATPTSRPATAARPSATEPPKATPKASPTPLSAAQRQAAATAAVAALSKGEPSGAVSVAALNVSTGAGFSAGATGGMWTASAYKLFALTAIAWSDGSVPAGDQAEATAAIENSDNTAGYELFEDAGGYPGLAAAATAFGMTHTTQGVADPAFTATSGSDYIKLLQVLVEPKSPISASSQSYILGLMRDVESDQRWGVGVVADPGTDFANKNGWLAVDDDNGSGEDDNGLWIVSSVGVVTVDRQTVLMAVFTEHQPDLGTGQALVQGLAKAIVGAVTT